MIRRPPRSSAVRATALAAVLGISAALTITAGPTDAAITRPTSSDVVRTLVRAYPNQVTAAGDNTIMMADGSKLDVDDNKSYDNFDQLLNHADLVDQLSIPYPRPCPTEAPGLDEDPGRLRYEPFFKAMYGSTRTEVERRLRSVKWFDSSAQVTTVNGVADALAAVASELADKPEMRKYLVKPGGGYLWRPIAGTKRLSAHSFGIAFDINTGFSDYWRWDGAGKPPSYRNRIPCEIAKVFERHGFIWGAKWYHYDTMHFEYRPELLS